MIEITNKENCCGCTACSNACPVSAIEMTADTEGFLYPHVSKENCINCGLCEKVCPIINKKAPLSLQEAYVARSKDKMILSEGSSGGIVTALGEKILSEGGSVCGAVFDKDFRVIHQMIMEGNVIPPVFRGSKYVQSNLGSCFTTIKESLKQGKKVCFVGTPCQVEGLKGFLCREYENLYTVDMVCHGVPSPMLWKKYLEYQTANYHSNIKAVNFRHKTYGYHSGGMRIEFENGQVYNGSGRVDYMLKSFFEEISSRYSCYKCCFKSSKHVSDLTVYDCWHAAELIKGLKDDDCGYTNVIVHSEKGKKWLLSLDKELELYPCDMEQAISLDGIMVRNSRKPHPKRAEFYQDLKHTDLAEHISHFIPVTKWDLLIEWSKQFIYRTGIYWTLKKIIKHK